MDEIHSYSLLVLASSAALFTFCGKHIKDMPLNMCTCAPISYVLLVYISDVGRSM